MKKRGPLFVILLSFITLGIYAIYWFYSTRKELYEILKKDGNAFVDIILCIIPFVNIWVFYKYSVDVEAASKGAANKWIILLAYFVFFPISQYIVQTEINKFASE